MARQKRLTGLNPLAYMGVDPSSPAQYSIQTRPPTTRDYDNWNVMAVWLDQPNQDVWILVDKSANVATWIMLATGAGDLETLTGDTGGAVGPDGAENINILSGFASLSVDGNPGTNTLTLNSDGSIATQYDEDSGSAVPVAGVLNVIGGTGIATAGAGNTVTITNTGISTSGIINLGMTVDTGASTITIHSADGTALSAANPGIVTFPSKATPGTFITLNITSNSSMDWSDMDGNIFGTVAGNVWDEELPFYVYAVLNDDEDGAEFALARVPHHVASGVTANIGDPGTANADTNTSFFMMETVTIGDFDDNPVVVVGSVKATKDALDAWTFIAVKGGTTGIGGFCEGETFTMPQLQSGATATYFWSAAGTIPTFTNGQFVYSVEVSGLVITCTHSAQNLAAGIGADHLFLMLPLAVESIVRAPGVYVLSNALSTLDFGLYKATPIASAQANGYWGVEFTQDTPDKLRNGDIDLIGAASNESLSGETQYRAAFNVLP